MTIEDTNLLDLIGKAIKITKEETDHATGIITDIRIDRHKQVYVCAYFHAFGRSDWYWQALKDVEIME